MPEADLTYALDEFRRVLYCLHTAELKQYLKRVLHLDWKPEGRLTVASQLRILIADWIEHLHVFSDAQRDDIVRRLDPQFQEWAILLVRGLDEREQPVITLAIHDYNWVSCSGRERFYDIAEMEDLLQLPREAVTHCHCDLTALYLRARARVAALGKHGRKEATHGSHSSRGAGQTGSGRPTLSLRDFADGKRFPEGGSAGPTTEQ